MHPVVADYYSVSVSVICIYCAAILRKIHTVVNVVILNERVAVACVILVRICKINQKPARTAKVTSANGVIRRARLKCDCRIISARNIYIVNIAVFNGIIASDYQNSRGHCICDFGVFPIDIAAANMGIIIRFIHCGVAVAVTKPV